MEIFPKNRDSSKSEPLRHGWGGDLKKRELALRHRQEDQEEQQTNPDKFSQTAHPLDQDLLQEMESENNQ